MSPPLEDALAAAPSVAAARTALEEHPGPVWIVGGAIRDALLGERVADVDLAVTRGEEERAARAIAGWPEARPSRSPRSSRRGERWRPPMAGTWTSRACGPSRSRTTCAPATSPSTPIALPLAGGEPIDPTGGVADADARILRAASEGAFEEDPLRLLRAARLAAGLGLSLDAKTIELARAHASHAADPAGERQFAELRGIVAGRDPLTGMRLMEELALLPVVLPELEALRGVVQNPNHHLDVLGHTLAVLEEWLGIEADLPGFTGDLAQEVGEFLAEPLADELTAPGRPAFRRALP